MPKDAGQKNPKNFKAKRIADFARRKAFAPASVVQGPFDGSEYIPIHVTADDAELLARFDMKPEDCWVCDAWWHVEEDVVFLQVNCHRMAQDRLPGIYARWQLDDLPRLCIFAVVTAESVTTTVLEDVMCACQRLGLIGQWFAPSRLGTNLTRVDEPKVSDVKITPYGP